jgi:hypothetical protein
MRYQPEAPPLSAGDLGQYLLREFQRIAATLDHPQATQINYGVEVVNAATSTALAINWKAGQKQRVDLSNSSSCALTFAAPEGVCNLMLRLVQDGTGSRAFTFPSTVKWQGGTTPTWSTAASAVDVVAMYYDGTNYHATASLDSK